MAKYSFARSATFHARGALRAVPLSLGRSGDVDARVVEPLERTLQQTNCN